MTIQTLDGVLAGLQPAVPFAKGSSGTMAAGRPHSLWPITGSPGAGGQNATLNGANLSSSVTLPAGALYRRDPNAGNAYLARFEAACNNSLGTLLLCDRLWSNGGFTITSTGAQVIAQPTLPARDANGSSNGDGVLLGLEVSAAVGANTPTLTVSYTNQAGANLRTGVNIDAAVASAAVGAFHRFTLEGNDTGVRSVQSLTLSASWTSGTINLVAYRVLAALELRQLNIPNALDALTGGMPRLYDGTVPFLLWIPNGSTGSNLSGVYAETWG